MVAIYRDLGNLESALKLLSAVERQGDQERPAVKMQKAIILWELKRHEEAYLLLKGLLDAYPESDRIKYLTAFGAERLAKQDEAMALYRAIPESSPLKFEANIRMILLLRGENRWDEAVDLARSLVEKPQTAIDSAALIVSIFADADRPRDALDLLELVLKRDSDNPRLLFLKGSYLEKLGERAECIKIMREVIRLDPENSSALNFLGYLFAERGEKLDEALELVKRALVLKPNDGFYTDSLGWVYYQKKDFSQALEALEKAVSLEPEEGVILEHLADTLLKLGRTKEAVERLEQALKCKLESKDRERIRLKLKEWGGPLEP
jgi:tetratricopeptide (TPR) repeat protein